jgi:hypothetical protein
MNDNLRRTIQGKVELYTGSTHLKTFLYNDNLQEITVARTGEKGKFFGFGICQQATIKIVDRNKDLAFAKGHLLRVGFKANNTGAYTTVCPAFYIKNAERDEKTQVYTITAYDALDSATSLVWRDLKLNLPYTLEDVVEQIRMFLGLSGYSVPSGFTTAYEVPANFGGDENLRTVLNALAEVTQTIYYIDQNNKLIFKRLSQTDDPVLSIIKRDYYEFTDALPVTISKIVHATELGNNYEGGTGDGVTQYIRENPFWNARADLGSLITEGAARIAGLTVIPHALRWRGNFLTEIGDKVSIEAESGTINTFILEDSFTYNGGLSQNNVWEYMPESEKTTASNPITIGEKINQTYAKVDKVNRQVTLYASELDETKAQVGELVVNTERINASISAVEKQVVEVEGTVEGVSSQVNSRIDTISSDVALKLDKTGVEITVEHRLDQGVDKVVTASKKYTFDDTGLNIESDDSEISTRILEDGMRIYKNDEEVLTASNRGVTATDLYATTFLIIGDNSRLENSGNRTACFWIGPSGE